MNAFLANAEAKLEHKVSTKERFWLSNLFDVISDHIYKSAVFNKPCEEVCLDVFNVLLKRNKNVLPVDHLVLSVSSLCLLKENKYFTGKFGPKSEGSLESDQIQDFNLLEERRMILIGFLTDSPTSDKPLHPQAGFLYLEDTTNAVICQLCEELVQEKLVFNNLVLLSKWNFVDIQFPVFVYKSDEVKKGQPNRLKYIEVIEGLIWIQKQESIVVPKALTIQEYFSRIEIMKHREKINVVGGLKALCTSYLYSKDKPYFLAKFYSPETDHWLTIAFSGYRYVSWYHLLKIGKTYVISNVLRTTMNKGMPDERKLLASTTRSDFYKVEPRICLEYEDTATDCSASDLPKQSQNTADEVRLKRKQDEMDSETERNVKRCKEKHECPKPSVPRLANSDVYFCSGQIEYEGIITAVMNSTAGVYEIDDKFRLFTHYMPCKTFGCGMRVGATVFLHNVHLCKLGQKVLGFVCCNSSTIRIAKHSMLDSPFQFWLSDVSPIFLAFQHLSVVDFIKAIDLCEHLSKKFGRILSGGYIIGPKTPLHSAKPTILSHVVDMETITSPSQRDPFIEFFSDPHSCIVNTPPNHRTIPTALPLKDLLHLVNQLDEQRLSGSTKNQYEWTYQEITPKELPENLVLLGWVSHGKENGQLYFCDGTSTIPCLITENELSETIHKCDAECVIKRCDASVVPRTDEIKSKCPFPQIDHLQAIMKLTSFRIIIETFNRVETASDEEAKSNNPLKKMYLVFSACHGVIIGKHPGLDVVASEKQKSHGGGRKEDEEKLEIVKNKKKTNCSTCRFVFLVKHKELEMFKDSSLIACVHGYILGKHVFRFQAPKQNTKDKSDDLRSIKDDLELEGVEVIKTVAKQEVILEFTNNCYWLKVLHPGRFYKIGELEHLNNTCQIERGLGRKTLVIQMSSNLRLEETDGVLQSCDAYEEWNLMAEQFVEMNSVRSSLSNWEQRKHIDKFQSKNHLLSFRGIILTRETVLSNDNYQCPFPSIPNDHVYLPRYGLIPRAHASAFSLGHCYLGDRSIALTVQDVSTADTIKMYLDFSARPYPLGLHPGAVVKFRLLQQHVSKQGNLYATLEACSSISIEALPSSITPAPKTGTPLEQNNLIEQRRIIDFVNFQGCGNIFYTLSYILCRIVAVQKVSLKWTCSRCGRLPSNCYCHVNKGNQTWKLSAQARCIIEDGTGEAMVFIDDDEVLRQMLFVQESRWLELKNMTRKQGEIFYQRSAYWKDGRAGGDSNADHVLSSMVYSQNLLRRIKILCRQFRMASSQARESRTIRVDKNEHATQIPSKVTLNVLAIHEMNFKDEIRKLIGI